MASNSSSEHAIRFMCRVLGVARSWFHTWRRAAPKRAERAARRDRVGSEIRVKDILVHLDESPQSETRMGIAIALAKAHDAHITANYTFPSHLADDREKALAAPEEAFRKTDRGCRHRCRFLWLLRRAAHDHGAARPVDRCRHRGTFPRLAHVGPQSRRGACNRIRETGGGRTRLQRTIGGRQARLGRVDPDEGGIEGRRRFLPILEKADEVTVVTVHAPKMGGFATSEFLTYLSAPWGQGPGTSRGRAGRSRRRCVGRGRRHARGRTWWSWGRAGTRGCARSRSAAPPHHVLGHTTVPVLMAH